MENLKSKIQLLVNLYKSKNLNKAEDYAKKLLRENKKIVFLYNILGLILVDLNKVDEAIDCFERGIHVNPKNIDVALIYNNLGSVHFYRKNYFEAENYYKNSIKVNSKNSEAFNNLGNLLVHQNKYDEGIKYYKKAIENNEKFIAAHYNIAIAYKNIGKFPESKKYLQNAIDIKNDFFTAHRNLSDITKYEKDSEHLDMMIKMYEEKSINKDKKTEIAFALGKAFNDIKDFNKAFYYYREGNNNRKKEVYFSKESEIKEFNLIKETFNEKYFKKIDINNKNDAAIFIVGMPRSGTTLIEQIISSHPKVYGGDEIDLLPELINRKFKNISDIANSNKEVLAEISDNYTLYLKKISNNSEKITDKLPINFKWVGLIKSIFPKAKIIHCKRNSKDVCLSIYRNYFTNKKLNFANNIDDIILFYNLYSDLMKHWHKLVPGFIIDVVYEDLITDPANVIKNLIKSVNLDWNDKCLKFYENKRPIKTASDTQARKAIYKTSINLWKNYQEMFKDNFKNLNE